MKIKLVRFMAFDGSAVAPRQLPGIGRVNSLSVGDVVKDVVDGEAIVSSLDYEPRSGAIVVRKTKKDDNPKDASRSWNRSPREGSNSVGPAEPKGDWCAISIGAAQIVGDDAPPPPTPGVVAPPSDAKPESLPPAGQDAKPQDPPPAQPVQKQGQQTRR